MRLTITKKKIKFTKVTSTSIQNLQAKLAGVLSISLILASACTDPSDIGLELDPENNQIGVFYTEIPLSASMVLLDSFNTTNSNVLMTGGDVDPFFGTTEAIGFSRLNHLASNRGSNHPAPTANSVLDSARFQFNISGNMTADSFAENKTLTVHRLIDPIQDITYYNTNKLAYEESPIATGSFRLTAGRDTIVNTALDPALANDLFNRLKTQDPVFTDLFSFRQYLPGIAIKGRVEEQTGIPVTSTVNTGIVLYYKNEGDTISRRYIISTAESRRFNHISNNRAGTPLEVIQERGRAYDVGAQLGIKANTGLVMKIDTSPLEQFLTSDTLRNAVFNQVVLEMGPIREFPATDAPFNRLFMYYSINNNGWFTIGRNQPLRVPGDPLPNQPPNQGPGPAALAFLADNNLYRTSITAYTNNLYRSPGQERRDFILHPDNPDAQVGENQSLSSVQGLTYKESLRQMVVNQNTIKLKIYYSKIR